MMINIENMDCIEFLDGLESETVDTFICDPPYSSGGFNFSDVQKSTSVKYGVENTFAKPDFLGDNKIQIVSLLWSNIWMRKAFRVSKMGGQLVVWCDWRSYPIVYSAMSMAGWSLKGAGVWSKTKGPTRPVRGSFWNDSEFMVLGVKGKNSSKKCLNGVWEAPLKRGGKWHQTQKPQEILSDLIEGLTPENGLVCDLFSGGGSTALAAARLGRSFVGCELSKQIYDMSLERLKQEDVL